MNALLRSFALGIFAASALTACGDDKTEPTPDSDVGGFELTGTWISPFGGYELISTERWDTFDNDDQLVFGQHVVSFDNAANSAITQNPADAEYGANTFNRIIWTEPTTAGFAYCTIAFGAETAEAAQAAPNDADPNDLQTGCSGFNWTSLSSQ